MIIHPDTNPRDRQREPGEWKDGQLVSFAPMGFPPVGAEWFFARWCALECMHLWTPPDIVREYLETGDPYLAGPTRKEQARSLSCFSVGKRDTARSVAWWYRRPPDDPESRMTAWMPDFEGARMSAAYASSGNIQGAAQWAIGALAWSAREAARKGDTSLSVGALMEASKQARRRLEVLFRHTALQIYRGERYA